MRDDVNLKIEWATKHIEELESVIDAFIKTDPYTIGQKPHSQTREHIYYVTEMRDVPSDIRLLAGDILQNLRTALDYLACALWKANGQDPTRFPGFPIFESVPTTKEQNAAFDRKVKGMRQQAINRIEKIEPYKGRNAPLWRLHELNIRDKHRLLLAVGVAMGSFNIGQHLRVTRQELAGGVVPDAWISPTQYIPLLHVGQELIADLPEAEVNQNPEFKFQVSFNESGVAEAEPIASVLRSSVDQVREVLSAMSEFLPI